MPLLDEFYSGNKYILGGKNHVFHLRGWKVWIPTQLLAVVTDNAPDADQFFKTVLSKDYTTNNCLLPNHHCHIWYNQPT